MKNMDFIIVNDSLREAKILASVEIVELLLSIGIALLVIYYSLVTQRKTINIFKNKKEKKIKCSQMSCTVIRNSVSVILLLFIWNSRLIGEQIANMWPL